MEGYGSLNIHMEPNRSHYKLKESICKAKTDNLERKDTQTNRQTHTQTLVVSHKF